MISRILKKLLYKWLLPNCKISYSQFGEDLIFAHYFNQKVILNPTYLDIGANEPKYISNTYSFYLKGSRGVLIEPNPYLYKKLCKKRPNDVTINTGIGLNEIKNADFYVFPNYANGLSTFSIDEAKHWEKIGMKGLGKIKIEKVIKMSLIPINEILEKYFAKQSPHLLSIDVEGLDLEILKSLNFEKFRPNLICVETLKYDQNQNGYKSNEISNYMQSNNYSIYADTWVNTIYVANEKL